MFIISSICLLPKRVKETGKDGNILSMTDLYRFFMWNNCTVRVFACCRIFLWLFMPPSSISQPAYLFFQAWSGWHFPRGTFACLSRAPEEKLLEKEGKGGSNQPCWELFLNKSWVMPESGPWGWMFHTRAEYQRCPCSPDPKPWVGLLPTPATYPGGSHIPASIFSFLHVQLMEKTVL